MKTSFRVIVVLLSLVTLMMGKAYSQNHDLLIRYDESAFGKAAKIVNYEDYSNKQYYALEVFREYIKQKGIVLSFSEEDYVRLMQRMETNYTYAHSRDSLQNQLKKQEEAMALMQKQNAQLSKELDAVRAELNMRMKNNAQLEHELNAVNKRLHEALSNPEDEDGDGKYRKAVDDVKKDINTIYNSNLVKPIVEMDSNQLDQAISQFEGMRSLLEVDPKVFKDLQSRMDEIIAWKSLIVPLKETKQFLKGKYSESTQKKLVAEIGGVTIKGSKAAEKDEALQYLKDGALLYENYCRIIRNLEDYGCLPTTETLWNANEMLASLTSNRPFYHPGVYDSYDRSIGILRGELSKSAPSIKVKTPAEFNKFVNELKEIF